MLDAKNGYAVYDFALLKLNRPLRLTNSVNLICLPLGNKQYSGAKLFTTGWGSTIIGKDVKSPRLMEVTITGNPVKKCMKTLSSAKVVINPRTILCAGNAEFRGTNLGDSGG